MIIEMFLNLCVTIIHWIFLLLPDIPNFNANLLNDLTSYVNLIFDNLNLLGFFIDIDMLKTMIPLIIIVINFEHIYHLCIWVITKIPVLNIKK